MVNKPKNFGCSNSQGSNVTVNIGFQFVLKFQAIIQRERQILQSFKEITTLYLSN